MLRPPYAGAARLPRRPSPAPVSDPPFLSGQTGRDRRVLVEIDASLASLASANLLQCARGRVIVLDIESAAASLHRPAAAPTYRYRLMKSSVSTMPCGSCFPRPQGREIAHVATRRAGSLGSIRRARSSNQVGYSHLIWRADGIAEVWRPLDRVIWHSFTFCRFMRRNGCRPPHFSRAPRRRAPAQSSCRDANDEVRRA